MRDLVGAFVFWRDALGLPLVKTAELRDQRIQAALLAGGSCEIELLQPTVADSGVARFLASRGEGLHHLCFASDDVGREVKRLWATGVELIDAKPRKGLAGLMAFVHPRACHGILVELATPLEQAPLPAAPLAVTAVHLTVEDVRAATHGYRDLFGLTLLVRSPDWSVAQLATGGVTVQFSSPSTTAGKPGMSALRLGTSDIRALAARFDRHRIGYRHAEVGLVLGPAATRGVPLIIGQSQKQENQP